MVARFRVKRATDGLGSGILMVRTVAVDGIVRISSASREMRLGRRYTILASVENTGEVRSDYIVRLASPRFEIAPRSNAVTLDPETSMALRFSLEPRSEGEAKIIASLRSGESELSSDSVRVIVKERRSRSGILLLAVASLIAGIFFGLRRKGRAT